MNKVERDFSEVISLCKIPSASRSSGDTLMLLHKIQNIVSKSMCPDAEKQYLKNLAYEIYKPYSVAIGDGLVIKQLFFQIFGDDVQEAYLSINPQGRPMGENHAEVVIEKAKSCGYVGKDPLEAAAYTLSLLEEVSSLTDEEGKVLFGKGFDRNNLEGSLRELDVTQVSTSLFSEERSCHKLAAFILQKYKEGIGGSKPTLIMGELSKVQIAAGIIKMAIVVGDASLLESALNTFSPFKEEFKKSFLARENWVNLICSSKASEVDKTRITTLVTRKEGFLATQRTSILARGIQDGDLSIVNGCLGAIAFLDESEKKAILDLNNWQQLVIDSKVGMTDRVNISFALHESGFLFTKDHFIGLFAKTESPTAFLSLYAKKLPLADKMGLLRIAVKLKRVDIVKFFVEDPDLGYSKSFKLFISIAPDLFLKYLLEDLFPDTISSTDRNYTIITQKDMKTHTLGVKVILQKSSEFSDLETLKRLSQNPVVDPIEKAYIKLIATEIYRRCQKRHENNSVLGFTTQGRLEEITTAYRVINPVNLSNGTKDIFKTVLWNKEMCIDKLKKELARAQRYGYVGDDPIEGRAHIETLVSEMSSLSIDAKKCFSEKRDAIEILEDPDFDIDGYQKFVDEIPCRINDRGLTVFTGTSYNVLAKFILQKVRDGAVLKKIPEGGSAEEILKLFLLRNYFVQAAKENQIETVELFLKMAAPVYWQLEALQAAIENGNFKLVELLATKDVLNCDIMNPQILSTAISFEGDSVIKLAMLRKLFEIGWKCSEQDVREILDLKDSSPQVAGLLADKLIEGILGKSISEKQLQIGQMILHTNNQRLKDVLKKKKSALWKKVSRDLNIVERPKRT